MCNRQPSVKHLYKPHTESVYKDVLDKI